MKMIMVAIVIGALSSHQKIDTWTEGLRNKRMSGDNPNYCIIKIRPNTKKNPRNLRRLSVTQTSVESHQQTLVGNLSKE